MKVDLNTATDAEINSLVAEHVAGWTYHGYNPDIKNEATLCWTPPDREYDPMRSVSLPRYTTDANAVLELLECHAWPEIGWRNGEWEVAIPANDGETIHRGKSPTFAKSAALALLRAKGLG